MNIGENLSETDENLPRTLSTVFIRPEYGTVEVRIIDTQNSYTENSLENHIKANLVAIDFADAIGKLALEERHNNIRKYQMPSSEINERMTIAYTLGLSDNTLYDSTAALYDSIRRFLSQDTRVDIEKRLSARTNPSQLQMILLNTEGLHRLREITTYFPNLLISTF